MIYALYSCLVSLSIYLRARPIRKMYIEKQVEKGETGDVPLIITEFSNNPVATGTTGWRAACRECASGDQFKIGQYYSFKIEICKRAMVKFCQ